MLMILTTMLHELARLTKQVLVIVRDDAVCRRLMIVPGVGPITALAFRATIDRPDRFRHARDIGAHLGLTPARYQSGGASQGPRSAKQAGVARGGETDIQGRVSRCGDELARTALYEAAHTLLVRSKKWSSLRAWGGASLRLRAAELAGEAGGGMTIAKHRGMARARVAVARKLAVILHRLWIDETEFRFGREPDAAARLTAA